MIVEPKQLVSHPPTSGQEEPPPYSPSQVSSTSASLPRIRPSNLLSVARSGIAPLNGSYVLDPCLIIPAALLPALPAQAQGTEDAVRPNLRLETRDGPIDAEVWIVPGAAAAMRALTTASGLGGRRRSAALPTAPTEEKVEARIALRSYSGPISLRVHAPTMPVTLHISLISVSGPITLALPRTFVGALSASGTMHMSPGLTEHMTLFEESDDFRRGWLGDLDFDDLSSTTTITGSTHSSSSAVHIQTGSEGSIELMFVHEADAAPLSPSSSLSSLPAFEAHLPPARPPPTHRLSLPLATSFSIPGLVSPSTSYRSPASPHPPSPAPPASWPRSPPEEAPGPMLDTPHQHSYPPPPSPHTRSHIIQTSLPASGSTPQVPGMHIRAASQAVLQTHVAQAQAQHQAHLHQTQSHHHHNQHHHHTHHPNQRYHQTRMQNEPLMRRQTTTSAEGQARREPDAVAGPPADDTDTVPRGIVGWLARALESSTGSESSRPASSSPNSEGALPSKVNIDANVPRSGSNSGHANIGSSLMDVAIQLDEVTRSWSVPSRPHQYEVDSLDIGRTLEVD